MPTFILKQNKYYIGDPNLVVFPTHIEKLAVHNVHNDNVDTIQSEKNTAENKMTEEDIKLEHGVVVVVKHPQSLGLFATKEHDINCLIDPGDGTSQLGIVPGIFVQAVRDIECGFFIDTRSEVKVEITNDIVTLYYTPRYGSTAVSATIFPMMIWSELGIEQTRSVMTRQFTLHY